MHRIHRVFDRRTEGHIFGAHRIHGIHRILTEVHKNRLFSRRGRRVTQRYAVHYPQQKAFLRPPRSLREINFCGFCVFCVRIKICSFILLSKSSSGMRTHEPCVPTETRYPLRPLILCPLCEKIKFCVNLWFLCAALPCRVRTHEPCVPTETPIPSAVFNPLHSLREN